MTEDDKHYELCETCFDYFVEHRMTTFEVIEFMGKMITAIMINCDRPEEFYDEMFNHMMDNKHRALKDVERIKRMKNEEG